jgi:prepilin-type N-terminal cleavage/methylation domain-containing protein
LDPLLRTVLAKTHHFPSLAGATHGSGRKPTILVSACATDRTRSATVRQPARKERVMFRHTRTGIDEREHGFTLIELMVVVLIIAILLTVAIPVFWAARERSVDRAAQANLTTALKTVGVVRSDNEVLTAITPAMLEDAEPEIAWFDETTTAESRQHEVSVASGDLAGEDYMILSTHTPLGDCLAVRILERSPTTYHRESRNTCPANAFDPAVGWSQAWPSL